MNAMQATVVDDVVALVVALRPWSWIAVSRRWRIAAINGVFAALERASSGQDVYDVVDIITAVYADIGRFMKWLGTDATIQNIKYLCNAFNLIPQRLTNVIMAIYSRWRELHDVAYDVIMRASVEYATLDYAVICRLVDEHGLEHIAILEDIETGIWNALFERDGFMFHDVEWRTDDAAVIIRYAIRHHSEYIRDYIMRSGIRSPNWDGECLTRVLEFEDARKLVSGAEYAFACETAHREIAHKIKAILVPCMHL